MCYGTLLLIILLLLLLLLLLLFLLLLLLLFLLLLLLLLDFSSRGLGLFSVSLNAEETQGVSSAVETHSHYERRARAKQQQCSHS